VQQIDHFISQSLDHHWDWAWLKIQTWLETAGSPKVIYKEFRTYNNEAMFLNCLKIHNVR